MQLLALAVALLAIAAPAHCGRRDSFTTRSGGVELEFADTESADFVAYAGDSAYGQYVRLRLGAIEELDASGSIVSNHTFRSLSSEKANYTRETVEFGEPAVNTTLITLTTGIDFDTACGAGSDGASLTLTVYVFEDPTMAWVGDDFLNVVENSVKFNILAENWPFCDAGNSLRVNMDLVQPRGGHKPEIEYSPPVEVTEEEVETAISPVVVQRKLLHMYGSRGGRGRGRGNYTDGGGDDDDDSEGGRRGRGPRKMGCKKLGLFAGNLTDATLQLPDIAIIDSGDGELVTDIGVEVTPSEDALSTRVAFTFPYFVSLDYDPVLAMDGKAPPARGREGGDDDDELTARLEEAGLTRGDFESMTSDERKEFIASLIDEREDVWESLSETELELVDGAASLRFYSGRREKGEYVHLKFGAVQEITPSGDVIDAHSIRNLSASRPDISREKTTFGTPEVNATVITLTYNLTDEVVSDPESGCIIAEAAGERTLSVVVYVFEEATTATIGDLEVEVPANGIKFNIDAANWPFCAADNSLRVHMRMLQPSLKGDGEGKGGGKGEGKGGRRPPRFESRPEEDVIDSEDSTDGEGVAVFARRLLDGKGMGKSRRAPHKSVGLFAGNLTDAELVLPEVAVVDGTTTAISVGYAAAEDGLSANITFTFPHFATLDYDPTLGFRAREEKESEVVATADGAVGLELVDRAASLNFYSGPKSKGEYVSLVFGAVEELDAAGQVVSMHSIRNLSDTRPALIRETVSFGSPEVSATKLTLTQTIAFDAPVGCSIADAAGERTLALEVYVFEEATTATIGDLEVEVPANGIKFNIDAANWPFCAPGNSLRVGMKMLQPPLKGDGEGKGGRRPPRLESRPEEEVAEGVAVVARRLLDKSDKSKSRRPKSKAVKLFAGNLTDAELVLPEVAMINGAVADITVDTAAAEDGTYVSVNFTFPYFAALDYDPTVGFAEAAGEEVVAGPTAEEVAAAEQAAADQAAADAAAAAKAAADQAAADLAAADAAAAAKAAADQAAVDLAAADAAAAAKAAADQAAAEQAAADAAAAAKAAADQAAAEQAAADAAAAADATAAEKADADAAAAAAEQEAAEQAAAAAEKAAAPAPAPAPSSSPPVAIIGASVGAVAIAAAAAAAVLYRRRRASPLAAPLIPLHGKPGNPIYGTGGPIMESVAVASAAPAAAATAASAEPSRVLHSAIDVVEPFRAEDAEEHHIQVPGSVAAPSPRTAWM